MRHFEVQPIAGQLTVQTKDSMIIYLLMEGTGTVHIAGKDHHIESGTVIMQNPGFEIQFFMDTDGFIGKVCYKTSGRSKKNTIMYAEQTELLFRTFDYAFSTERMLVRIASNYKLSAIAREIDEDLLQLFERVLTASGLDLGNVSPVVEKVCIAIESHFTDPGFDLMREIRKTGYSGAYFRRCFRSETGRTPTEYLRMRRINCAKELLRKERDSSISEIALCSGFRDQSVFSLQFKKQVGLTPSEFRDRADK